MARPDDRQTDPRTPFPSPDPGDAAVTEYGLRAPASPNVSAPEGTRYEGAGVMGGVVALLVAAILLVIMVGQNLRRVPFHFLGWSPRVSLALLILITAVVVLVIDQAIGLIWRRRRRRMRRLTAR